ncbi:hypothetical protein [Kangiella koreensis]|uniref:Uncharacterized protein n=1 Tax=Kangiella koreensis (strain DSM 16069 / JCM 12317 / KCTC 12182 / SW-125) TaxID=523791 RepID=C7R6R8_KANKD|nr:hypothetical protein [Kangiella koreensis]ACV25584.1 conserved hypothetical protein [Kangiella koreensis DSM 16069]
MYRIPKDLDLSKMIGEFTTQIAVGQNDIQLSFGSVTFTIESKIMIIRDGKIIGIWEGANWPTSEFYEIMNVHVVDYKVPGERTIVIVLENNMEIHMHDDSDHYECIQISIDGNVKWLFNYNE